MPLGRLNFGNVNTPYLIYQVPELKQVLQSPHRDRRQRWHREGSARANEWRCARPGRRRLIEYDVAIGPNAAFERTGLVLGAGEAVFGQTDTLGVAMQVYGFEEYSAVAIAGNPSLASGTVLDSGQG